MYIGKVKKTEENRISKTNLSLQLNQFKTQKVQTQTPKINITNHKTQRIQDNDFTTKAKAHFKQIRQKFQEHIKKTDQIDTAGLPDFIKPGQIINYFNKIRANPKEMARQIRQYMKDFISDKQIQKNGVIFLQHEGKEAFLQAAQSLEKLQPLNSLQINECLNLAALDLVIDLIGSGLNSYSGSDNSTAQDRICRRIGQKTNDYPQEIIYNSRYWSASDFIKQIVISITVDDGLPSRGRRQAFYQKKWSHIGVAVLKNPGSGHKCVITLYNKDVKLGIPEQNLFNPIYKSIDISRKEIADSMVLQKKHVLDIRAKFQKFLKNTQQIDKVKQLKDFIPAQEVLYWLNNARTNPIQFANHIREQMKSLIDNKYRLVGSLHVNCIQGKSAYQQAIQFLEKQLPLPALELNQCLSFAASDHLMDMIMNNFFGHISSDGSNIRQRVQRRSSKRVKAGLLCENCDRLKYFQGPNFAQQTIIRYIVDEGVPSRGHRNNIYKKQVKYVGISMIKDPTYGFKNVLDFSNLNIQCLNKEGGTYQLNGPKLKEQYKTQIKIKNNRNIEKNQKSYKNLNKTLNPEQKTQMKKDKHFDTYWEKTNNKNKNITHKVEQKPLNTNQKNATKTQEKQKKTIKQETTTKSRVLEKGILKTRVVKTIKYSDGSIDKKVSII